jgi:hypothetical protein
MLEKVFVDQNNVEYGFPPEGGVMEVEPPEPVTILGETIPDYITILHLEKKIDLKNIFLRNFSGDL